MAALVHLSEGPRIFVSSIKNRFFPKKYGGTAREICEQVVRDCWNGRYFQASTANFAQFWTRDFGWCTKSLLKLGYEKEVHQSLRFALNHFQKENKITTTISSGGKVFDFPVSSVDSLPYLLHSIKIAKFSYHSYMPFLNRQIKQFFDYFIDKQTGLVKPHLHVSSMKDYAIRKSSCYDNTMVGLLAKDLKGMRLLFNPFKDFNYPDLLKKHFWNGRFFYDDLDKKNYVAGDANLFPFIFGLISDKEMIDAAVDSIQEAGLDNPFPLKYTPSRKGINFIWEETLVPGYESDTLWTHMGLLFVKLMQEVDKEKAERYQEKYTRLIERHKGFLEVFTTEGKPYSSPFYHCDRGMLWAANYLTL